MEDAPSVEPNKPRATWRTPEQQAEWEAQLKRQQEIGKQWGVNISDRTIIFWAFILICLLQWLRYD